MVELNFAIFTEKRRKKKKFAESENSAIMRYSIVGNCDRINERTYG